MMWKSTVGQFLDVTVYVSTNCIIKYINTILGQITKLFEQLTHCVKNCLNIHHVPRQLLKKYMFYISIPISLRFSQGLRSQKVIIHPNNIITWTNDDQFHWRFRPPYLNDCNFPDDHFIKLDLPVHAPILVIRFDIANKMLSTLEFLCFPKQYHRSFTVYDVLGYVQAIGTIWNDNEDIGTDHSAIYHRTCKFT